MKRELPEHTLFRFGIIGIGGIRWGWLGVGLGLVIYIFTIVLNFITSPVLHRGGARPCACGNSAERDPMHVATVPPMKM